VLSGASTQDSPRALPNLRRTPCVTVSRHETMEQDAVRHGNRPLTADPVMTR